MRSFANTLTPSDIKAVAAFVKSEFVNKKAINTYYHTPGNGWPDHRKRYGSAYPFVLGKIAIDTPAKKLTPKQIQGLAIFKNSCITCHNGRATRERDKVWEKYPLSNQGCGVVCHKGKVSFPWRRGESGLNGAARPVTPYAVHGVSPVIKNLSVMEKDGERIYQKNCSFCHAMDGTGGNWIGTFLEPHARNLTNPKVTAHLKGAALVKTIEKGLPQTSMPAWKNVLDEKQIASVAAYIRRAFFRRELD